MDVISFVVRLLVALVKGTFIATFVSLMWGGKLLFRGGRWLMTPKPTSHGSARWATWQDLVDGEAWGGRTGIIVGAYSDEAGRGFRSEAGRHSEAKPATGPI